MKIPRIFLQLCFLIIGLNTAIASNGNPVPFTINAINFNMDSELMEAHNIEISYQEINGNLFFTTEKEITFLQIFNQDDTLEFQLPVMGKIVILDLDDLKKGNYKVNMVLEGNTLIPGSFTK